MSKYTSNKQRKMELFYPYASPAVQFTGFTKQHSFSLRVSGTFVASRIEGKCEQVLILFPFPLRLVMEDFQRRL